MSVSVKNSKDQTGKLRRETEPQSHPKPAKPEESKKMGLPRFLPVLLQSGLPNLGSQFVKKSAFAGNHLGQTQAVIQHPTIEIVGNGTLLQQRSHKMFQI